MNTFGLFLRWIHNDPKMVHRPLITAALHSLKNEPFWYDQSTLPQLTAMKQDYTGDEIEHELVAINRARIRMIEDAESSPMNDERLEEFQRLSVYVKAFNDVIRDMLFDYQPSTMNCMKITDFATARQHTENLLDNPCKSMSILDPVCSWKSMHGSP